MESNKKERDQRKRKNFKNLVHMIIQNTHGQTGRLETQGRSNFAIMNLKQEGGRMFSFSEFLSPFF
jgi:hypothetical protein